MLEYLKLGYAQNYKVHESSNLHPDSSLKIEYSGILIHMDTHDEGQTFRAF
jgi:hypothetical protein